LLIYSEKGQSKDKKRRLDPQDPCRRWKFWRNCFI